MRWSRDVLLSGGADAWSFVWFLNWWPWAVAHGHSLLRSTYVYAPVGYDLTWATPIPTAALLGLPVTLTLGALAAFNLLSVSAPALTAFCAFLLIRRCGASLAASLLCGALAGFSPYETGQVNGHLNLSLNFPVPLACLLAVQRFTGVLGRRAFLAALTATLVAEFGLSAELFASLVCLGSLVCLAFLAVVGADARPAILGLGGEMVMACLASAAVLSPWLVHMALSAGQYPGFINEPAVYSTNLENLIVPTRLTALGGRLAAGLSSKFSGNLSEQGGYLGLPLIAVLSLLAWQRRGDRMVVALLVSVAGIALASLGPSLHVGAWDSHIPLPWWFARHLPLLRAMLPGRFSLYVAIGAAVGAGVWHRSATTRGGRTARFAVLLGCAAVLLPDPAHVRWRNAPLLPFFAPATVRAELGRDANVLILPYLSTPDGGTPAMLWQWQSGMGFRQAGGFLSFVPVPFGKLQFVGYLMRNEPSPYFRNDLSAFCALTGVPAIVAGPGTSLPLLDALHALGWQQQHTGGIDLFRVPPPGLLRYIGLSGDIRVAFGAWSAMGGSAEVTTHEQPGIVHLDASMLPTPATLVIVQPASGAPTRYAVAAHGKLDIKLPANGRFLIRSGATFVPALVLPRSLDYRPLSFLISVEPF